jgi:hypothetical protein
VSRRATFRRRCLHLNAPRLVQRAARTPWQFAALRPYRVRTSSVVQRSSASRLRVCRLPTALLAIQLPTDRSWARAGASEGGSYAGHGRARSLRVRTPPWRGLEIYLTDTCVCRGPQSCVKRAWAAGNPPTSNSKTLFSYEIVKVCLAVCRAFRNASSLGFCPP